jgi:hypothetical protein
VAAVPSGLSLTPLRIIIIIIIIKHAGYGNVLPGHAIGYFRRDGAGNRIARNNGRIVNSRERAK